MDSKKVFYARIDKLTRSKAEDVGRFLANLLVALAGGVAEVTMRDFGVLSSAVRELEKRGIVEYDPNHQKLRMIDKSFWK